MFILITAKFQGKEEKLSEIKDNEAK